MNAWRSVGILFACWLGTVAPGAAEFSVATYNVAGYLVEPVPGRKVKPIAARETVCRTIAAANPDIVALQEVGGTAGFLDLRRRLSAAGRPYPHARLLAGVGGPIQLALLSRHPITRSVRHTNDVYLVEDRRERVARGLLEVDVRVGRGIELTLLVAHLKSRRPVPYGDERVLRNREALILRRKVEAVFAAKPDAPLIVLGDLNDTPDSRAVRTVIGRGKAALVDLRPAEPGRPDVAWTYHFARRDTYSRVDYLLANRALARTLKRDESMIFNQPEWRVGSDHRLVLGTFEFGR